MRPVSTDSWTLKLDQRKLPLFRGIVSLILTGLGPEIRPTCLWTPCPRGMAPWFPLLDVCRLMWEPKQTYEGAP